jgi:drug/metabolite transporter (DMT)-like permease
MIFWGFSFIWSSLLLKSYQPVTIIFIRLIISSVLLFALLFILGKKEKIGRKDYKLIFLSALFNPFLYFLGENYGLKFSSPTIAAVIIATIPVFSPLIGYLTFREKLTPVNLIGIAVSFGGVMLMLITPAFSLAADVKGICDASETNGEIFCHPAGCQPEPDRDFPIPAFFSHLRS